TLNQPFTYTITVTNNGPSTTQEARIADAFPTGLTFVSATPSQGSCSFTGTLLCPFGPVASGASATAAIAVTAPTTPGTVSNTATVSPVGRSIDGTAANNSSTATTTVTAAGADLSITKTAPATVPTGQALTYTLSVHNAGPSDATGVAVTDTMPTGVTFASGSAGCVNNSGTVTCTIGNLANGANASATIAVTAPSTTGPISNSATVSGSPADTNTGDNTASASTNVAATKTITVHNTAELQNVFGKNDIAPAACDTTRPPNLCPSAGDTILLASNNYFPTASLDVTIPNLTIMGPGTSPGTQVSGSGIATASALSGNPDIFDVGSGVTATFRNLFLTQTQGGASALDNFGGTAA